ncbi:glutamine--fructose-6-phosphate transaminase (isomerizing) [Thiothrix unzii]|uniref:Glutamine--fructose-6-phosphate aminotransferase [isomerizing] n=1 Tax=Thiothrix unzii TaxID=111769 RepID=A0A975FD04_9GAMM|nr:glutamine--fructose-6-phosphate transaminase (isomerizing) [Thiothrix unzii]QTR55379.1 glutamine--fructose-6-phosphate transaminase (isomerizing) [Thiothrix unzii]
MCGIVGFVSNKKLFKEGFNSLRSLEYRGYDSFGFGAVTKTGINMVKMVGAISDTDINDFSDLFDANVVIGHTRWATHGGVTKENSHPHISNDGKVGIVHNGVIANYSRLVSKNPQWTLLSETDTEVAANVISDSLLKNNENIISALENSLKILEGEFAICGIIKGRVDTIFAIKRKSPLAIGMLEDTMILSSDMSAFSEFSRSIDVMHLDDESIFLHTNNKTTLFKLKNNTLISCDLSYKHESLENQIIDLAGYPHFMLKEINGAGEAIKNIFNNIEKEKNYIINEMLSSDLSMTGSGSAYYVAMIGQYFFSRISGAYVATHPSDEFLNIKPLNRRDLIISISQSGETFDTLEVIRKAKENKSAIVSINNVFNCSMQRLADFPIFQGAGKEVCVLSTKSIISQVGALYLLATEMGLRTGKLSNSLYHSLLSDYKKLPEILNSVVSDYSDEIKRVAYQNCNIEHWFFIGRGAHYPVALESALKFKEVSYLHAEGMPAGFFKHGTISLIDKNFYTVVFLPSQINDNELYQSTIDNIYEIKARGGNVIGFGHQISKDLIGDLFFEYIALPDVNEHLNILIQLVAGQLLAYYSAVALNRNIDKPRSLAKSVTVR